MSIGIVVTVHDGIVLAADSASTLTLLGGAQGVPLAINVYNNANKIANLLKGEPIGCVAFGSGSIGSASLSTIFKDFRKSLTVKGRPAFDRDSYTVEGIAGLLRTFLEECISRLGPQEPKPSLGLMIAGYSKGSGLGQAWELQFSDGVSLPPKLIRAEGDVGINWGGEQEAVSRLVHGISPSFQKVLAAVVQPTPPEAQVNELAEAVKARLQAPLAFAPMPIQDAIDLAEWLVDTAKMFSRFTPGPSSVGGPVESAAITKHEGFKWVRRKHYFDTDLNPKVMP